MGMQKNSPRTAVSCSVEVPELASIPDGQSVLEALVEKAPTWAESIIMALTPSDPTDGMTVLEKIRLLPRAGVYARVSTGAQEEEGTSLDTQVIACVVAALQHGYQVDEQHIWRDTVSGASSLRPGWSKAMGAVEDKEIEAVFIYDPDRLARRALLLLNLCDQVEALGGMVHFLHGPAMDTEEGQLIAYLTGFAAGRERRQIAERTMRAKRYIALGGRMPVGVGGPGIFGYDYDTVLKVRTINEVEAAAVRSMFEWYASGKTTYGIAKELNARGVRTKRGNPWHPKTVEQILRHTSYIGVDYYGKNRCRIVYENRNTPDEKRKVEMTPRPENEWVRIEGFSPRILEDDDLFWKVQRWLDMPRAKREQKDFYFLTGFARCSVCNTRICGGSRYAKRRRYRCRGTQPTSIRGKICKVPYLDADKFEEAVLGGIKLALRNPDVVLAELEEFFQGDEGDMAKQVADLKKKIQDCQRKESRLLGLYGDELINEDRLKAQIGPLKLLREECERTLARIQRQRETTLSPERIREVVTEKCLELSDGIDDLDHEGKRGLMLALDVQVVAVKGEVSIWMTVSGKCTTTGRTSA